MLATFCVFMALMIATGTCGFLISMYLYRYRVMSGVAHRQLHSRSEYHRLDEVIFQ